MIQPYPFFLLRRPAYPTTYLTQFYQQLESQSLQTALLAWYQNPLVQQAIYVASQPLYERCQRWLLGEPIPEQEKLLITLHKYLIRMCTRCTPYGHFAGCALGTVGNKTILEPSPEQTYQHVRPDFESLLFLKEELLRIPAIRNQLRLYPNSSFYPVGDALRYVEQQRENNQRQYFISSVSVDTHLTALFARAQQGATLPELTDLLIRAGAESDVASDYLEQLLDSQLLVYEIEPNVIGDSYYSLLLERLSDIKGIDTLLESLRSIEQALKQSDERMNGYQAIRAFFETNNLQPAGADVVQVDTFFPADTYQLNQWVIRTIQRQFESLMVLNQPYQSPDLQEFKRRFYDRYEHEEVPLAYALDHESGVGYGNLFDLGVGYSPLIDSLTLPSATSDTDPLGWNWWQSFVLGKYADALRHNRSEVTLTDADLKTIQAHTQPETPPSGFFLFGTLLANDTDAIDRGEFRFNLLSGRGPSAVNLMSRFCEGNPELATQIRQCALDEEQHNPDVIIAEIVHFPDSRAGNILTRPSLHTYEIPYMGKASVPLENQILLTDLVVSVHNDQLVLRSKRLNKRVIPRLSSAHNFQHGLPIYRFLCDLQYQDSHLNVQWNWGQLSQQTYLPRVCYRNIIVSRATWLLQRSDLPPNKLDEWPDLLVAKGMPEQFVITVGDNELLLNTRVPDTLRLLDQELRKQLSVRVTEFLAGSGNCPVGKAGATFTHELILPFQNTTAPAIQPFTTRMDELPQRRFSVGSEWLYLKIYTGEKVADTLLVQDLYPTVKQLLSTQIINQFHFVRYKDSDTHLRLRFRGNPHVEFYHYVIRAVERALHPHVQTGEVHKIQTDTYQRELERYGMHRIESCEALFHHDSLSTLQFLAQTGETFDENLRFGFAIHKIDALLRHTQRSNDAMYRLISDLKERFFEEFNGDSTLRQQLNERYRTYRPLIEQALSRPFPLLDGQENWMSQQQELLLHISESTPDVTQLNPIVNSLIHMSVNRLFPSKQRAYELVLYHCLAKHYDSVRSRLAQTNTNITSNA
ncbi:lantibiotic dehydratase [Spirosoma daeguense]